MADKLFENYKLPGIGVYSDTTISPWPVTLDIENGGEHPLTVTEAQELIIALVEAVAARKRWEAEQDV